MYLPESLRVSCVTLLRQRYVSLPRRVPLFFCEKYFHRNFFFAEWDVETANILLRKHQEGHRGGRVLHSLENSSLNAHKKLVQLEGVRKVMVQEFRAARTELQTKSLFFQSSRSFLLSLFALLPSCLFLEEEGCYFCAGLVVPPFERV